VAMPYPSQGHVNSMINLCNQLASLQTSILITIVVTQEWLASIASHPKPSNIRFATIPNVIPLQSQIASDITAYFQAVVTNLQTPFRALLHRLHPTVTALLADVELHFPVALARTMDIPVALLWTMSASFFLSLHQLRSSVPKGALKADLLGKVSNITAKYKFSYMKHVNRSDFKPFSCLISRLIQILKCLASYCLYSSSFRILYTINFKKGSRICP